MARAVADPDVSTGYVHLLATHEQVSESLAANGTLCPSFSFLEPDTSGKEKRDTYSSSLCKVRALAPDIVKVMAPKNGAHSYRKGLLGTLLSSCVDKPNSQLQGP